MLQPTCVPYTNNDKEQYKTLLQISKKYNHYKKTWLTYNRFAWRYNSHEKALDIAYHELYYHTNYPN